MSRFRKKLQVVCGWAVVENSGQVFPLTVRVGGTAAVYEGVALHLGEGDQKRQTESSSVSKLSWFWGANGNKK